MPFHCEVPAVEEQLWVHEIGSTPQSVWAEAVTVVASRQVGEIWKR
jgi:hypothetical protein